MLFWLIFWLVAMVLFLLIPICCYEDRRKLWMSRLRQCRCNAVVNETNAQDEEYHYVLSRAQEDGIRESFLLDKLHQYTKTLDEQDIVHNATDSTDDASGDNDETTSDPEVGIQVIQDDDDSAEEPARTSEEVPVSGGKAKGAIDDSSSDNPPTEPSSGEESGNDDVPVADEVMGEFIGDCISQISVPNAGALCVDTSCTPTRTIPNGCAICLSTFVPNDKVTWSSNANCGHVFHHSCILNWLMASGRKNLRRSPRIDNRVVNYAIDPVKRITNFPMHCPCCRQDFIDVPPNKDESDTDKASESSDPAVLSGVSLVAGEENV